MIIAIDFDGTICQNEFPKVGELIPDAARVIKQLKLDGHTIIINTCRCGDQVLDAVNFLQRHKIPFDVFNDNDPINVEKYGSNSRKVYAHCYIDDRNIGGLPPWSEMYENITATELAYRNSLKTI